MSVPTTEQRTRALRMVAFNAAIDAINEVENSQRGQEAMDETTETWDEWTREIDAERMAITELLNAEIKASDDVTKDLFTTFRKKS